MCANIFDLWDQEPGEGLVRYSSAEVFDDQTGDDQRCNRVYSNVSHPTLTVHRATADAVPSAAGRRSGSRIVNALPSPGADRTRSCPPQSCTAALAVESPSPAPCPSGLVVKNGWKMWS